jgi:hypothetical protein
MGRFILPELFGVSTGLVVFFVVLMALSMFYGAEISEKFFGQKLAFKAIPKFPARTKTIGSSIMILAAIAILILGQPSSEKRWEWIAGEENKKIEAREIFVHPRELLQTMNDTNFYCKILDVRSQSDYNLFHLENAQNITQENILDIAWVKKMRDIPKNTILMLVSNDEEEALKAYKILRSQGIINLYVLEGGINHWLSVFPAKEIAEPIKIQGADVLRYLFAYAVGSSVVASNPGLEMNNDAEGKPIPFTKKIKMQVTKALSGGCG